MAAEKTRRYPDTTHHVREAAFQRFMENLVGAEFRLPELLRTAFNAGWAARKAAQYASILEEIKHD